MAAGGGQGRGRGAGPWQASRSPSRSSSRSRAQAAAAAASPRRAPAAAATLREMEQRNRLGALGYLPPLLLHGLLLFVADGERGNFATAMGSGESLLRPRKSALATAEEKRKRQASRSPAILGVQPRLGVGRGTRADEGLRGCGVRLGSLSVGPPLSRGGLQRAKVGAPQPGLQCCGPICPAPCTTRSEAACSKWRGSASALQLLPELCWRLPRWAA